MGHPGDWTAPNVIQSLVAAGTLIMAAVTALAVRESNRVADKTDDLAKETKREVDLVAAQVRLASAQIDLTRMALQASNRPMLVNVPLGLYTGDRKVRSSRTTDAGEVVSHMIGAPEDEPAIIRVVFPVRNIGTGPALIGDAIMEAGSTRRRCQPSALILAAGERGDFEFLLPQMPAPPGAADPRTYAGPLRLELSYSDSSGQLQLASTVYAQYERSGYVVRSVTLRERGPDGTFLDLVTSQV